MSLTGDMKEAFLQVRIREEDRDTLRFHWISDLESQKVEVLRFTPALFGLAPSPFLLGGVIKQHLETCRANLPELVREIQKSLYVDDLVSGGQLYELPKRSKMVPLVCSNKLRSDFTSGIRTSQNWSPLVYFQVKTLHLPKNNWASPKEEDPF